MNLRFKVFLYCSSVLLFCYAAPQPLVAQELPRQKKCDESTVNDKACPDLAKIADICTYVSNGSEDPNPIRPRYKFVYQRKILDASRVDPTDTPEMIQKKVSTMWPLFQDFATCTSDIQNGSLLKFGIASSTYSSFFLLDVIQWKVPFNSIDPSDNKTLLDYLKVKVMENNANVFGPRLQGYYNRLRLAGAKHKSELNGF